MNFAYNKVSLRFYMPAIAANDPKLTIMKIMLKKNFKTYDEDVCTPVGGLINGLVFS